MILLSDGSKQVSMAQKFYLASSGCVCGNPPAPGTSQPQAQLIAVRELKIQRILSDPSLRIRLITETDLNEVDPEGRSFLNVNTLSDLESARSIWIRQSDRTL